MLRGDRDLWLGEIFNPLKRVTLSSKPILNSGSNSSCLNWVGGSAILAFSKSDMFSSGLEIVTVEGGTGTFFLMDFIGAVMEVDGVRICSMG